MGKIVVRRIGVPKDGNWGVVKQYKYFANSEAPNIAAMRLTPRTNYSKHSSTCNRNHFFNYISTHQDLDRVFASQYVQSGTFGAEAQGIENSVKGVGWVSLLVKLK